MNHLWWEGTSWPHFSFCISCGSESGCSGLTLCLACRASDVWNAREALAPVCALASAVIPLAACVWLQIRLALICYRSVRFALGHKTAFAVWHVLGGLWGLASLLEPVP